jgi:chromosome segregation ATPase
VNGKTWRESFDGDLLQVLHVTGGSPQVMAMAMHVQAQALRLRKMEERLEEQRKQHQEESERRAAVITGYRVQLQERAEEIDDLRRQLKQARKGATERRRLQRIADTVDTKTEALANALHREQEWRRHLNAALVELRELKRSKA